jgi:hypothetical protein
LSPEQREELLRALRAHFEKNMNRHKGLEWAKVQAKLGETVGVIRQRIGSFPLLSPRPVLRCSLSPHPETARSTFRLQRNIASELIGRLSRRKMRVAVRYHLP